ncbi:hypothetical protein PPTG_21225 [Phytophthora nicotianae INRA-310]|uniref:Uncharacterized protein n=2 Tax=Phytophthora nicotianae TaxID=4792 RepID=W2R3Z3_PHYN3|nr:hypothetical protein PPTG_21225 [Phytophthora nicotianae INRA-310]ETM41596.1 hypothetical protein L914_12643 [Phytophthora nicotianae]ETN20103.1 hypothetical protein PPTG_21225 [Phytophthora nicotianae INRA-310]
MGFVKMLFRCSARAAAGKVCLPIKHECNKDSNRTWLATDRL